jgi:mono/diheme cytochrome c family protein
VVLASTSCGSGTEGTPKQENQDASQAKSGAEEKGVAAASSDPSAFFLETVKPAFEKDCSNCHSTQPKSSPAGPVKIFSSVSMIPLLDSADPASFSLLKKVKGQISHGGGNRCEPDASICNTILQWHQVAVKAGAVTQSTAPSASSNPPATGNGPPGSSATPYTGFGEVTAISPLGDVLGFAVDPTSPADIVQFEVYINGTNTTGTLIAKGPASKPGFDRDFPGDHRFSAQIPESYRNGVSRTLSVYSVSPKATTLINPGQTVYVGYSQTAAGKAFFASNVLPLANCAGCHNGSLNYDTMFGWLMTPGKHMGATARNNKMLNNPGTANGEGHGGGNRCGNNIDTGLCKELQQWWTIEFGSL